MKGTISVESVLGEGTTFAIRLPVTRQASRNQITPDLLSEGKSQQTASSSIYEGPISEKPLLLIIEDNKELQDKMFQTLGISKKEAHDKFGFFLEAFQYGSPPHGGIAIGYDRFVAILTNKSNIKDTIAFPKTKSAECIMQNTPSLVTDEQLKEIHIKLDVHKKK